MLMSSVFWERIQEQCMQSCVFMHVNVTRAPGVMLLAVYRHFVLYSSDDPVSVTRAPGVRQELW